jgi:hypothetical protein
MMYKTENKNLEKVDAPGTYWKNLEDFASYVRLQVEMRHHPVVLSVKHPFLLPLAMETIFFESAMLVRPVSVYQDDANLFFDRIVGYSWDTEPSECSVDILAEQHLMKYLSTKESNRPVLIIHVSLHDDPGYEFFEDLSKHYNRHIDYLGLDPRDLEEVIHWRNVGADGISIFHQAQEVFNAMIVSRRAIEHRLEVGGSLMERYFSLSRMVRRLVSRF